VDDRQKRLGRRLLIQYSIVAAASVIAFVLLYLTLFVP
jgi:hypothetical protein